MSLMSVPAAFSNTSSVTSRPAGNWGCCREAQNQFSLLREGKKPLTYGATLGPGCWLRRDYEGPEAKGRRWDPSSLGKEAAQTQGKAKTPQCP